MKSGDSEGWDSATVCRLTRTPAGPGLSVRQLQYWDRTGLLAARAREKKRKRLYGFEDVLRLRIIAHLVHSGLPVQKVRAAIRNIEKASSVVDRKWQSLRIVTDGTSVFVVDGDRALDAIRNQLVSLVLIGDLEKEAKQACRSSAAPTRGRGRVGSARP
jgi:DNA-binding transcriptional MerR regulator